MFRALRIIYNYYADDNRKPAPRPALRSYIEGNIDTEADTQLITTVLDPETIRYHAYLLAEADGNKQAPECYWELAEVFLEASRAIRM